MTRYCPNCGEMVTSDCITCPKCYKKMPEENPRGDREASGRPRKPDTRVAFALDIVLGFVGILGVGQLYQGKTRGAVFTIIGLIFFVPAISLVLFTDSTLAHIVAIPLFIIYGAVYVFVLLELMFGVSLLFRSIRRGRSCAEPKGWMQTSAPDATPFFLRQLRRDHRGTTNDTPKGSRSTAEAYDHRCRAATLPR